VQRTRRTVEAEIVDAVATLPDEPDDLPADMAEAIAALHLLEDACSANQARSSSKSISPRRLRRW
jgi:hypothetical protein